MAARLSLLALLHAGRIMALPQMHMLPVAPVQMEPSTPTPIISDPAEPTESLSDGIITPPQPDDEEIEEICSMPFNTAEEATDTWKSSGAFVFLRQYLRDHGVEGWANDILRDTAKGGSNGPTFDCESLPGTGCNLPEGRECKTYDPPEAFFVHLAIANLNSAFNSIYTAMIGDSLKTLGSKVDDVESVFGKSSPDGIWPTLIGLSVVAGATMAKLWGAGSGIGVVVGGLNLAAGSDAQEPDLGDTIAKAVLATYETFSNAIEETFLALLAGDFGDLEADDPVDFITSGIGYGQMMVVDLKDQAVEEFRNNFRRLLEHVAIFQALKAQDYELWVWEDQDNEDDCKELTEDTGLWMDFDGGEKCMALIIRDPNSGSSFSNKNWVKFLDDDKMKGFDRFHVDLEEAFRNLLECNGGELDLGDAAGFDGSESYPPCMLPGNGVTRDAPS